MQLLLLLWLVIEDHDNLFVMAETVHFIGIAVLVYKLVSKRNCGGTPNGVHLPVPCWQLQPYDHSLPRKL